MSRARPSLLSSGLVALDVIKGPTGTWLRAGGTAANVAAILSFLGWRSAIIGRIGDDDAGPLVERDLCAAGVDTSHLDLSTEVGTPLVVHEIHETGHRFRFGCNHCGRRYRPHRPAHAATVQGFLDAAQSADVFFFDRASSASLRIAAAHSEAGKLVVYEPGNAGRQQLHALAFAIADIVKFSDERRPLFEVALPEPRRRQLWIETKGPSGARYRMGPGSWRSIGSLDVVPVDTGGAGDWFTAGVLSQLVGMRKWGDGTLDRAVRYALALAGLSCLVPGARALSEAINSDDVSRLAKQLIGGRSPQIAIDLAADAEANHCPACRLPLLKQAEAS